MKKTLSLTSSEVAIWVRTLAAFDSWIVYRAIIRVGLSREDFVSLGDVTSDCSETRAEFVRYGTASFPTSLRKVAMQFHAEIDPPPQPPKKAITHQTTNATKLKFKEHLRQMRLRRAEELQAEKQTNSQPVAQSPTNVQLSPEDRERLHAAMRR